MFSIKKDTLNITGHSKIWFIIVAVVLVVGVCSFIFRGFYLDTDFVGGTTFTVSGIPDEVSENDISLVFEEATGVKPSVIQRTENYEDSSKAVSVRMVEISNEAQQAAIDKLKETYSIADDGYSIDSIGGTVSGKIRNAAITATILAVVAMLIYMAFRFKWRSALAAVCCLVHDLFVMLTLYSLLQIPLNSTFIATMLTILGYSINATIIIFDRIRENKGIMNKTPFDQIVNKSVTQTFMRSVNTTLTTLFTISLLYIFGVVYGVDSIRQFALPIIAGLVAGFFSSVFLSGTLLNLFGGRKEK